MTIFDWNSAASSAALRANEEEDVVQQSEPQSGYTEEEMLRTLEQVRVAVTQGSIDAACR